MPFATTKHLNLRAFRDSDKAHIVRMLDDQRVSSNSYSGPTIPMGMHDFKTMWDNFLSKTMMLVIVEARREDASLRKCEEGEKRVDGPEKKDWDAELFVGYAALSMKMPKNRDANYAISLMPQWWGNGFGTEVTEWVVQHGFEQLALHRISLGTPGCNRRAHRVYEKCGFVREGAARQSWWNAGKWEDHVTMGILEEEYWARKKCLESVTVT